MTRVALLKCDWVDHLTRGGSAMVCWEDHLTRVALLKCDWVDYLTRGGSAKV